MVALRKNEVCAPWAARPALRPLQSEALPLVRVTALADRMDFPDTGCDVSPSCLRCPLVRCKYEEPPPDRTKRDREIALLHGRYGAPVPALMRAYSLSRRQIYRILRESRCAPPST